MSPAALMAWAPASSSWPLPASGSQRQQDGQLGEQPLATAHPGLSPRGTRWGLGPGRGGRQATMLPWTKASAATTMGAHSFIAHGATATWGAWCSVYRRGSGSRGRPGRRGGEVRAGKWTARDLSPAASLLPSTRECHAKPPSSPWRDSQQSSELVPGAQAVGFRGRAGLRETGLRPQEAAVERG